MWEKRMHYLRTVIVAGLMLLGVAAIPAVAATAKGDRSVIIYYSWSGNSEAIARELQRKTGGELLKIEPVIPYSTNYNACVDDYRRERENGLDRPIKTIVPDLSRYGTVYICYPIWGGTIPTPIITMLRHNDFTGAFIMPVASHGGGGPGRSASHIASLAPSATVADALSVRGSGGRGLSNLLDTWMKSSSM